jgi:hypothetical protein
MAHVIEGGDTDGTIEGVVSKRKVFCHAQQKREAVLLRSLEPQRIDSDVGLPIRQKTLIEAGTTT